MTISKRLRTFRNRLGMTQCQLGSVVGKKDTTITRYESGERNIPQSIIWLLNEKLGLNPEWLETGEGKMFDKSMDDNFKSIAIYESNSPYEEWVNETGVKGFFNMPEELSNPENIFMIRAADNTMSPLIQTGDLIAIDKKATLDSGGIYATVINDAILIKKISIQDELAILVDTSSTPLVIPKDKLIILGKAVWLNRKVND